ncbi:MAG: hypothetical protein A2W93_15890 [Bacteroidetes bacterium GWF2_43_63]|nr:MAG: hypothetical protein A2W94_13500 [Bacteroidetes bacterium GWE2_42_42]OFY53149.1 MAG: hypothetical protein A2W93_15890 [Bacteroidetes bacterium GWF2_43_63]HBG70337.1 hypothetical protein [Bacteroidales bacterium]HCB60616.1 hypothetical protein [Bacteroidales bacterium]HCY22985.1 hypothetical protein [Bacteroidales bacterium]
MKSISLQEHINQSRIAAAANRAKGNRHGQILSMLYSDPYHFIEELIQNAEDAIARRKDNTLFGFVKIIIDDNGISFFHNGDPFSETDLMAITTFASTTKKGLPGINQIGKFGIGFRSVYGITDLPEIHSGKHHYRISDFEVLEECEPRFTEEFTTHIFLPFKPSVSADFRNMLKKRICGLNPVFLLFLKQIMQIEIVADEESVVFSAETDNKEKNILVKTIVSNKNGIRKSSRYILFQRSSGPNRQAAIAFPIDESDQFIPEIIPQVAVYFPTQFHIAHSIIVHGSFTTTPNRENIPFSEEWTPENNSVLAVLSDLMRISLRSLLSNKLITTDFWKLFSWNNTSPDPISASISECLSKFVAEEKCLADASGKLHTASGLCVSEDGNLFHLLTSKDIASIYSRFGFLHLTIAANDNFVSFLRKVHKLKLADIDSFAFHIAGRAEFLQKKPLGFYPAFYRFLSEHPRLWDLTHKGRYYNLRHKAIIPDKSRRLTAPFSENEKPQIFIGKAANGFSVVHPELASDADCMNFFAMLGIPDFAPGLTEADMLMRRFKEKTASAWWRNLFELYVSSEVSVKERIREKLKDLNCLPCIESQSGNKVFVKPYQAIIPDKQLTTFLSFHRSLFVNPQLITFLATHDISVSRFNHFLTELGVNNGLKFIETETALDDNRKSALRAGFEQFPIVRERVIDWTIEGLDSFLTHPTPAAAAALWFLLGKVDEKFRKASYTFESYVRSETVHFTPAYISQLKIAQWIFDEQLNPASTQGFSASKLHSCFNQASPESIWMAEELGMITDHISAEEKEILSVIRKHKLNAGSLQELINSNNSDIVFFQYLPLSGISVNNKNAIESSSANLKSILASLPFATRSSQSWDQCLFEEKSQILKNHLLSSVLSESKRLQPVIENPGHVQIRQDLLILTHYFTGVRPAAGEAILMPATFATHINERPERLDTGLYVFNLSDNTCVEVAPENLSDFLKNNTLAFINSMKLAND